MDYSNACGASAVEVAPRSPHHAAMLVLEQRVAQLSVSIDTLERSLDPALRQSEPQPTNGENVKDSGLTPKVIAHVDVVTRVVDSCISRVENIGNRLVI